MSLGLILFSISYGIMLVSLESTLAITCPSGCSCPEVNVWSCTLRLIEQIDCSKLDPNENPINVDLNLFDINVDRQITLFANTDYCKISLLKIVSNKLPPNRFINNLNNLERLIIQGKSSSFANRVIDDDSDNLLVGLHKLTRMKIEYTNIKIWSKAILEKCYVVEEIEFKNIQLENIEPNSFANCQYLTKLTIRFNAIRNIYITAFTGLRDLQTLTLTNNELEEIITNGNAWWNFPNLTRLDFSYNRLSKLNSKLFVGLHKLKHLILRNNQIQYIDKSAFDGLINLNILNLYGNPKLFLLDLSSLQPMLNSLTQLNIDVKLIQCIDMKSQLSRFNTPIQTSLKNIQDCNKNDRLVSSSRTSTDIVTYASVASASYSNLTLIVSFSVVVTILVMGLIFFLLYWSTSRKTIQKYKSAASDNMTIHSGNSRLCSQSLDNAQPSLTASNRINFTTMNHYPNRPDIHLLQKYSSDSMLPRI